MTIKIRDSATWDALALGEVMIRLDPGEGRIHTTRSFQAWEGGGEYNVARGLRRCFGLKSAVVTAYPDNQVGRLAEDLILQGGVDTSLIKWVPYDGLGRASRVGLNFTERGYGCRGAVGCSDRGHTAVSQLKPGDIDFEGIFAKGVKWFHTGGIFAALGEKTPEVVIEAAKAAKRHGTVVSYDLNFRPSLWKAYGGSARAQEVNREIAKYVDVMIGNEEDFTLALGFQVAGLNEHRNGLDPAQFQAMIADVTKTYPNFQAVATTLREVHSATVNDWSAVLWHEGKFYQAPKRDGLLILDRVGGGDSFASGVAYGFLAGLGPQAAVDYGAAHGALAMTTPGDTSMAPKAEVEALVKGGSARVAR
jgi:2-dehydro-3-deoxygluconokinase